jgi:hypothetical protein
MSWIYAISTLRPGGWYHAAWLPNCLLKWRDLCLDSSDYTNYIEVVVKLNFGKSLIDPLPNYWGWSSLPLIYLLNFAKPAKLFLERFWMVVCYSNNGFATVTVVLSFSFYLFRLNL